MVGSILDECDVAELAELLALIHDDADAPLPWPFLERLKALIGCVSFGGKDSRRVLRTFLQSHDWDAEEFSCVGSEYQDEMVMSITDGGPGRSLRLVFLREDGPEFGDRERFLVRLLRPHIAEAYRAALRRRAGPPPLTPARSSSSRWSRRTHQPPDRPLPGAVGGRHGAHPPEPHLHPARRRQPDCRGDPGTGARRLTESIRGGGT